MAQTFTNLLTHVIFSTKGRVRSIQPQWKPRLLAYMGGIIRELDGKAVAIDGTGDHVHMLLWMPPTRSISETLRVLKTNSSRWVNRERGMRRDFTWQAGYGAFSVSHSNAPAVVRYIRGQEKHHRRVSFQEEFVKLLQKNNIEYDERYIWE
ncbi:MAG: transposase [Acidobacteria bacterium RIFCSPLOWO2_02_FULL_61_28]|nr:MAG: transposase [Acidobacteria bacterium RIFCSPLOWO2_02_FULL_61_28]